MSEDNITEVFEEVLKLLMALEEDERRRVLKAAMVFFGVPDE